MKMCFIWKSGASCLMKAGVNPAIGLLPPFGQLFFIWIYFVKNEKVYKNNLIQLVYINFFLLHRKNYCTLICPLVSRTNRAIAPPPLSFFRSTFEWRENNYAWWRLLILLWMMICKKMWNKKLKIGLFNISIISDWLIILLIQKLINNNDFTIREIFYCSHFLEKCPKLWFSSDWGVKKSKYGWLGLFTV